MPQPSPIKPMYQKGKSHVWVIFSDSKHFQAEYELELLSSGKMIGVLQWTSRPPRFFCQGERDLFVHRTQPEQDEL